MVPPEEHTPSCARLPVAATERQRRTGRDTARVVNGGSFCEQPPLGSLVDRDGVATSSTTTSGRVDALAARRGAGRRPTRSRSCRRPSCRSASTAARDATKEKGDLLKQVDGGAPRASSSPRPVLRPGAARAPDDAGRGGEARRPHTPSSTPRTPARWRRSANSPAPSPTDRCWNAARGTHLG